ncbi:uncharacterized protein METZ01_LOCUS15209 [marine metagenome]|uniref:Uncharacterized protein n=1 Tax=marine metagenome TaxID=408172 RepID=A0A381P5Y2_9ZZZZ
MSGGLSDAVEHALADRGTAFEPLPTE